MSTESLEGQEGGLSQDSQSPSRPDSLRGVVRTRKKVGSHIFVPPVNHSGSPEDNVAVEEWRKSQERIKDFLQCTVEILNRCYHLLTLAYHPEKDKLSIYRTIQFITERPTYFVRDYFAPLLDSCDVQDNNLLKQRINVLELIFSSMRADVELKRPACDPNDLSFILDAKINPRLFGDKGVGNLSEELSVREFLSQSDQQFRKRSRLDASSDLMGTKRDKYDNTSNNFLIQFEVLHDELRRVKHIDAARHASKIRKSNTSIKQTLDSEIMDIVANLDMKFKDSKAYDYYFRDSAAKTIYPLLSVIFRVFVPTFSMVEVMVSSLRNTKHFLQTLAVQRLQQIDKKIAQISEWIKNDDVYINSRELYAKTKILSVEFIKSDFFALYVENHKFTLQTNGDVQLNLMQNVLTDTGHDEAKVEKCDRGGLNSLYTSHSQTICEAYRDCLDTFIWLEKIIGDSQKGYIIQFTELLNEALQLEVVEAKQTLSVLPEDSKASKEVSSEDVNQAILELMDSNVRKSTSAVPSGHKSQVLGVAMKRSTSGSLASTPKFFQPGAPDPEKVMSSVLPRRKFRPSSGSVSALSPRGDSPRSHNSPRSDNSPRIMIPPTSNSTSPRVTPELVADLDLNSVAPSYAEGSQTIGELAKK